MASRGNQYKPVVLALLFLYLPFRLFCQSQTIDSLLRLLRDARHDSTRIVLNYQLADQVSGYDISMAEKYLQAGYALAKPLGDEYYTAYYLLTKAELLFDMVKYEEAGVCFDSAMLMYDKLINSSGQNKKKLQTYKFDKVQCLIGKGLLAAKQYNYQESIRYYLQGIADIENIEGNEKNSYLANLYADIASDYYELEQFENALKYDKKGLQYLHPDDNIHLYVVGHLFVADDFSALLQFDSSSAYLEKVRPIVMQQGKPALDVRFYYILGGIYRKKKDWTHALTAFQKAHEAAGKLKDDFQLINSSEGIAACYMQLGDLAKARQFSLYVFNEANRVGIPLYRVQSLQLLTEIEEKSGNIGKAYQYQKQWMLANDSLEKEKVQKQMNEVQGRYESIKKEKEILQLQKSNALQSLSLQKKSTFNYVLVGSVMVLLITGLLVYRNFRNRQQFARQQDRLQQQQIRELEKDRQLVAVDSMLKGQEDERSRLAKDLHDGLGGLLSGVKFSLIKMKDNLIITPDTGAVLERSLDMIDTSIKELRRVAYNMMPEMLTRFGLDEVLKDYCNTINATQLVSVKYHSHGMETRLDKSTEIIIYRIIQELLNNILKHASASEAFVNLVRERDRLSVVVEDNGRGYDTTLPGNNKGSGWTNIRARVGYLKGQVDVHSAAGKGTLVNMEFKI
jgi:two-component system, NarL family, sensor kinase